MAVAVRGLKSRDEYEQMLAAVAAGFGHEVEAVRRRFERHPPYELGNTRVTIVDGRIVSVVHVHVLRVRGRKGETWVMGAVGEVSTPPEHRHHGYSTMALQDSIARMEGIGCDFSMLGTGIQAFYERLGWCRYPRDFITFDPAKVVLSEEGTSGLEVREIDWHNDLSALQHIYEEHNRTKVGPLIRSEEYWREATSPRRRSGSSWVACGPGGPVAYLWGAAELRVLELPHLDGEEDAARALLHHALGVAREESFKQVVVEEAVCPQASETARAQSTEAVSRSVSENTMFRPVAPGFSIEFAPGELLYYGTDGF